MAMFQTTMAPAARRVNDSGRYGRRAPPIVLVRRRC
jgi:hypothetical protein